MNAERLHAQIIFFAKAVNRLADALNQPKNEFIRDAAIQRFEFTFELAWKVLKNYLEREGLEARSPRAAIRGAFSIGLLPEDEGWLVMVELRNLSSHTYNEAIAERIYTELPAMLHRFQTLLAKLDQRSQSQA